MKARLVPVYFDKSRNEDFDNQLEGIPGKQHCGYNNKYFHVTFCISVTSNP